jgi:hypothetical protein
LPTVYWLSGYNIKEGKMQEYQALLGSKAFKKVCAEVEKESGMKFLETYGTVIPSSVEQGDYDAYDLWEMPSRASLDNLRQSPAMVKLSEMTYKFIEPKPRKSVLLRKFSDLKVFYEPKR